MITLPKNLKITTKPLEGYVYKVHDGPEFEIVHVTKTTGTEFIARTVWPELPESQRGWNVSLNFLSKIPETHKEYDDAFVFYEIGKKEEYPELFL